MYKHVKQQTCQAANVSSAMLSKLAPALYLNFKENAALVIL